MSGTVRSASHPQLSARTRMNFDPVRQRYVLLNPESVTVLNSTAAAILRLCDGNRSVAEIVTQLRTRFQGVSEDDVRTLLTRLAAKRWVVVHDG